MSVYRKAFGGLLAATLLATSSAPAFARPWHGGGWGGHRYGHYHRGGWGTGNALLGGLIIGGAAVAIGTAIDNDNDRRAYAYDNSAPPPPPVVDTGPPEPSQGEDQGPERAIASQGEAVDACSDAAVDESRGGQVSNITRAAKWTDGWQVEGVVDRGVTGPQGYRALDRFSCSVRFGRIDDFQLNGTPVASRD